MKPFRRAATPTQRARILGCGHDLTLGGFPLVTLAEARDQAFENRRKVRRGGNPLADRRRSGIPTFRDAAARTRDSLRARWRNGKHAKDWMAALERYAFPVFGNLLVDRIRREDVLRVLTPIWSSKPETARRVRQRIRAVLGWAWAHDYVFENVAGEGIDGALPALPAVKAHLRALPYGEVSGALERVEASGASAAAKLCLRFLILTAARSGEARGATWAEVDVEAREWRIPGERMKGGGAHRVPLSDAALAVLEQARALDDGSGLVFPSPLRAGHPLSDMSLITHFARPRVGWQPVLFFALPRVARMLAGDDQETICAADRCYGGALVGYMALGREGKVRRRWNPALRPATHRMRKLATKEGRACYARGTWLSKRPHAWIKDMLGFVPLASGGSKECGEWDLVCLALNIKPIGASNIGRKLGLPVAAESGWGGRAASRTVPRTPSDRP